MHIEQNSKTKWLVIALVGLVVGGVLVLVMFLNKPQTYKTPAADRPGGRNVVCRWDISQIQPGYGVVISLLNNQGKVIRAIPDPSGNSYTFEDVDPASFPARCRLELVPKIAGLEACVKEVPVTCQNIPTETPTPGGPTSTPAPSVTPGGPTNTPAPTMTPSIPTATPIKSTPTSTPAPSAPPIGGPSGPTNTPVPLAPTTKTAPGQPTSTPAPTNTSVPNGPTKFPELPKAGINTPTMLIVAMGVVVLLLAFAL